MQKGWKRWKMFSYWKWNQFSKNVRIEERAQKMYSCDFVPLFVKYFILFAIMAVLSLKSTYENMVASSHSLKTAEKVKVNQQKHTARGRKMETLTVAQQITWIGCEVQVLTLSAKNERIHPGNHIGLFHQIVNYIQALRQLSLQSCDQGNACNWQNPSIFKYKWIFD